MFHTYRFGPYRIDRTTWSIPSVSGKTPQSVGTPAIIIPNVDSNRFSAGVYRVCLQKCLMQKIRGVVLSDGAARRGYLFVGYEPYTRNRFHPDRQYHALLLECCTEKPKHTRCG